MAYKVARWNMTDRCNFSCAYCTTPNKQTGNPDELSFEEIRDHLIPSLVDAHVWEVNLLGGEPTEREDFLEIIRLLRENYLGVVLVTNGSHLTTELCQKLVDLKLTRIHLSIDSHLPDTNQLTRVSKNQQSYLSNQINAAQFFIEHGIPLHINTVVNSLNYDLIYKFIDYLAELGVRQVSLIGEGRKKGVRFSHPVLTFPQLLELGKGVSEKILQHSSLEITPAFLPLRVRKYLNDHFQTTLPLQGAGGICKPGAYEIMIHSDGTVLPCNAFLTDDPNLISFLEIEPEKLKVTNTRIMDLCKSRTYQKAFQLSQTGWYRQSLQPCGKCDFMENGCYPCVFPRLQNHLKGEEWEKIVIQPFCQYIFDLEGEEFNRYRINPQIVWQEGLNQLTLYHPEEVEILTLTGAELYLWNLLVRGYVQDELAKKVGKRYGIQFADPAECQQWVAQQLQEWHQYNYILLP